MKKPGRLFQRFPGGALRWLWLALFLTAGLCRAEPVQPDANSYRLGSGDLIEIRVFGEDDLTVRVRLDDSGKISYPFLGDLQIKGRTPAQLETMIIDGLKGPYLVNPVVSVNIEEYRPFFVNGEVHRPGAIPYQPGITLRKAIAMAGGFTERAQRKRAEVIRSGEATVTLGMDDHVNPGDIVTIGQSFF
jgi:polysaccharide export outer membrane protein